MLQKKYPFVGYLAASMLLGTLSFAQAAKTPKDPRVLPGYNKSLQKGTVSIQPSGMQSTQSYAKGEAIVVFKKGLSVTVASSLLATKGVNVVKEFKTLSSQSKHTYMLVSGNISTEVLISKLKEDPNVQSVSPNYKRMIDAMPNDPKFGDVWGLHNTGQAVNGVTGTADADIDAPEAWNTETDASDTVVAVFDTGVEYNHEDLAANMWVNSAEASGAAGVDDDGNGYVDDIHGYDFAAESNGDNDADPMDIHGHGTHVSGTIGAKGNNGVGITGVNWDVNIMAIKVFRPDMFAYDSDILEAIDYVLIMKGNGMNIVSINASYGGVGGSQIDPMNDAIKTLGTAGIVFAAAAGNGGDDHIGDDNDAIPHYPSSYDASNIITVAATDQNDNLTGFSNYGLTSVDLAAPGSNILSTLPGGGVVVGNIFSDDIEAGGANWTTSGTNNTWAISTEEAYSPTHAWSDSPAANYVDDTNASLTYALDIDLSAYTGQAIGVGACMKYNIENGWDYLHIEASGDSGANWTTLESITGVQTNWGCNGVTIPEALKTAHFRMRFRFETDFSVTYDGVYIDDIVIGTIGAPDNYAYWGGTSMATPYVTGSIALMATLYPGEDVTQRINRILSATVALTSLTGKVVTGGLLNIANAIENSPPVAQDDADAVAEDSSVNVNVLSNDSDADGDALSIDSVTVPDHGTGVINGTQITYTPDANYNGSDSFDYTISDGHGGTDTATVSVTVTPVNDAPVAVDDADAVAEDSSVNVNVLSNDSDADGDALSIDSVTVPDHGTGVINGTQITYTPDANYNGSDSFDYTISDGHGGTDTATVNVTVNAESSGGGGGGGGCTYNPNNKSFDLMFIVMMIMSFFYPLRHKYYR